MKTKRLFQCVFYRHPVVQLVHLAHGWRHGLVWLDVLADAHRLAAVLLHRDLHPHGLPR